MADLNKKFNDLKVQIFEVADKRPKASSSNSGMWCTKCGTSGHTKEDCTTVNVKYIEDPAQEVLFIFQNDATTNYVSRVLQHQPSRTNPSSHQEDIILLNLLDQRSLKSRPNQCRAIATIVESRDIFHLTVLSHES
ncbi:hypothetical protein O6H91_04G054700 [Diphasiastrum complanatum]|uniref:Uncharacterized protein n=1 Tax=Diphasiastrum complanatum TaxID=34168 RepID=A0ACC2DWZ9_DIPCM|nr:hypothetical protein O6H91_04G054700 [Diphasiastrum complanatum]